jgi:hypothetical protein
MSELERFSIHSARQFADKYSLAVSEKQMGQSFWRDFFSMVCGIDDLISLGIEFEYPVRSKETGKIRFIDVLWGGVVLIEHKSAGENLDKAESQARDYLTSLEPAMRPPVFILSDFKRFRIIEVFAGTEVEFELADLPNHLDRFVSIIGDNGATATKVQTQADIKAAKLMSELFVEFEKAGYSGHEVSVFLVRVLFLLFGEDTRMFKPTTRGLFTDFVEATVPDGSGVGGRLQELFEVLNTPVENRPSTAPGYVKDFPYVNGGLFSETIRVFSFNKSMRDALLKATNYDWSLISPAIFGSLFQFARDKETRREMGEHFTSEEFILRCINDLFLNDFNDKLNKAWDSPNALRKFQKELGTFNFLDPACGSGNFLVVAYKKMREIELKIIARTQELQGSEGQLQIDGSLGLQVHLSQFHGIEYDDWSSSIATVAMHLADHQANLAIEEITGIIPTRFPLKESAQIVQGNALEIDWAEVCPMAETTFIIGNPPFNGSLYQSEDQKEDTQRIWGNATGSGLVDYVTNWFLTASRHIAKTNARAALVSTNSITQGIQPSIIWSHLAPLGIGIDFAHRTFAWTNESSGKAAVHVVILGFSKQPKPTKLNLWDYPDIKGKPVLTIARNINGYLIDAPNVLVASRKKPLSPRTPPLDNGSKPADGGHLSNITPEEAQRIRDVDPVAAKYLRILVGGQELLRKEERYCLWLLGADPSDIRKSPELSKRVSAVRSMREASTDKATKKDADRPSEFQAIRQPKKDYIAVPQVSSEGREYVPITYFSKDVIVNNQVSIIENGDLVVFGFISSKPFRVWVETVSGRLKSDFRIGGLLPYNNFPFPEVSDSQATDLISASQAVIDARALFPSNSLADLYDPNSMPSALRKAHDALDRSVMKAFDMKPSLSDPEILAALFIKYEEATKGLI